MFQGCKIPANDTQSRLLYEQAAAVLHLSHVSHTFYCAATEALVFHILSPCNAAV